MPEIHYGELLLYFGLGLYAGHILYLFTSWLSQRRQRRRDLDHVSWEEHR